MESPLNSMLPSTQPQLVFQTVREALLSTYPLSSTPSGDLAQLPILHYLHVFTWGTFYLKQRIMAQLPAMQAINDRELKLSPQTCGFPVVNWIFTKMLFTAGDYIRF